MVKADTTQDAIRDYSILLTLHKKTVASMMAGADPNLLHELVEKGKMDKARTDQTCLERAMNTFALYGVLTFGLEILTDVAVKEIPR